MARPRVPLVVRCLQTLALGLTCSSLGFGQNFDGNTTDIPAGNPSNASDTENVDFGDVDNDGDWDAVFADGGDTNPDQNRLWINRGPGVDLGVFDDMTNSRMPAVNDQSRDIEFVDFDGDGDLDLYTANISSVVTQPCRWLRNSGSGFFVDETSTRWVGLGQAGSSMPASQVLGAGGFITYSGDGDFADLDNDGDLDLFHSTYGAAYGGNNPSRVFLNDGAGFFSEFNPSGFQLDRFIISNGDPGIWCEGTQLNGTTNSNGTQCDVAMGAVDIDLADVDGDFDIDVLHGDRGQLPRLFANRTVENGGQLGFRDVTGNSFSNGYATGSGHYEQEMGDLDGDGDVDIVGVNWLAGFGFDDAILMNDGSGFFALTQTLPDSESDDEEADFIDFDNDGDLDVYVADFSGRDRLYENRGNQNNFVLVELPPDSSATHRDADACDVDGDGDYDVFTAATFGAANTYLENLTQVADTHGPYIPNVEQAPNRNPGPDATVIRAHVYDNAPYYITWYNATTLTYTVNAGPPQVVDMQSSGGQVFRGEIPGNVIGTIAYFISSQDEYGNAGQSSILSFDSRSPGVVGSAFCFGDGSGGACPCNNTGTTGAGCANGTGIGGLLLGSGTSSVSAGNLTLSGSGLAIGTPGVYFEGMNQVGGAGGLSFGDGLRCAGGQIIRIQPRIADLLGNSSTTVNVPQKTGVAAGETRYYQLMYRDTNGTPCGSGFNVTQALQITWTP